MLKYTDYDIVFQEIPNEVTLAINLSNCPNGFKGCHSPQLMQYIGEYIDENVILGLLDKYGTSITCICFMGGDASPYEVEYLAAFIKNTTQEKIKTAWYSGKEKLVDNCNLNNFNFIKLGAYKEHLGGFEIDVTDLKIYQLSDEYPITPKEHGDSFLIEHRHLWLCSSRQHAIMRVRAAVQKAQIF